MKNFLFCILLFLFTWSLYCKSNVLVIKTEKEFDENRKNSNILVKFFAPWCGHCKKMAPEYEKAAKGLQEKGLNNVKLIKVDCTDSKTKNICSNFNVSGYPTLKYFENGEKEPIEYSGGRDSKSLVEFIKKVIEKTIKDISKHDELEKMIFNEKFVVVEYAESESSKLFAQIAKELKMKFTFAKISEKNLLKQHSTKYGDIIVYRSFDDRFTIYDGKMDLKEWIQWLSLPVFGELTSETYADYAKRELPMFWFGMDKNNNKSHQIVDLLRPVFKDYREKILAAYVDTNKFNEVLKSMGFSSTYPNAMIVFKNQKYKYNEKEFTKEKMKKFLENYFTNKLENYFRSSEVPKKNEGPLFDVVGDTFKSFVNDEKYDIVLEYYLSYCGHCKKFEPEYKKLAEIYKDNKFIKIARLNGEHNDTPFEIKGYPTVMLFPSGSKDKPITYKGERKANALRDWITQNSPLLLKSTSSTDSKKSKGSDKKSEL